jgi:DNA-binding MarR family transcriptional regulator
MTPWEEAQYGREMKKLVDGERARHAAYLHADDDEEGDGFGGIQNSHKRLLGQLLRGDLIGLGGYAKAHSISPQAARQTVKPLVQHGYVLKEAPAERRGLTWQYVITQKGRDALLDG